VTSRRLHLIARLRDVLFEHADAEQRVTIKPAVLDALADIVAETANEIAQDVFLGHAGPQSTCDPDSE
jgi:hypothetical protein